MTTTSVRLERTFQHDILLGLYANSFWNNILQLGLCVIHHSHKVWNENCCRLLDTFFLTDKWESSVATHTQTHAQTHSKPWFYAEQNSNCCFSKTHSSQKLLRRKLVGDILRQSIIGSIINVGKFHKTIRSSSLDVNPLESESLKCHTQAMKCKRWFELSFVELLINWVVQ